MKLDIEAQEALLELVEGANWPYLLKTVDRYVAQYEQDVLRLNIEDGNVVRLAHTKLRAEGARKLATDIRNLPALVKKQIKE